MSEPVADVAALFDVRQVRARAAQLLAFVRAGRSPHWRVDDTAIGPCTDFVLETIRTNYPSLAIPFHSRWRHFQAGGRDRFAALERTLLEQGADTREVARARFDLAVTSVLLDAGAGAAWGFTEDGMRFARSEGLAVASVHAFKSGLFSSDSTWPLRADAAALRALDPMRLAAAFQVRPDNPMVAIEGRAALLARLGHALASQPGYFGTPARIGNLVDWCFAQAQQGRLSAATLLTAVLWSMRDAWPVRHRLHGIALGDVWPHHAAGTASDSTAGWMPFHKLSQWLTYSLIEPLQDCGLEITDIDAMTGLPEYRNGGLLIDMQVVIAHDPGLVGRSHQAGDEAIVEWRALTVALLDEIATRVRTTLGMDARTLPLARVLEGGTWAAGRRIARMRRVEGGPPLSIQSDGTVF
jgi:hypothetical protein